MEGYSVKIQFASKELTAKERVMLKDTTGAVSLDEATQGAPVVIDPDFYATLLVHNEKAEDKDYKKHIIVDKAGTRYVTGSESFMSSFVNIMEEMDGSGEEFEIQAYRMPSKNYKGKEFLTCSIV